MHWRRFCGLERNSWQLHNNQSHCGTFKYWRRRFRYCGILWSQYFFLPVESGPVPLNNFLSPLSSYPTRNEHSPYWCLGKVFMVRSLRVICRKYTQMKVLVWTVFPLWRVMWTRISLWNNKRRQKVWWVRAESSSWWIFSDQVHSLNRERDQEMIYLKEGSSLQPLRQGWSFTAHLQQTGERLGINWGEIGERAIERSLAIYEK